MYAHKSQGRRAAAAFEVKHALLSALAHRDPELSDHVDDVAELAAGVAATLGCDPAQVEAIRIAAELHDIGKIAIPEAILDKPGPLTGEEWALMRQHTIAGERIILASPALADVAPLVRSSHERWDGAGYPDQLAGESIPLGARIIAVCDSYHAMTSDRTYRRALSVEVAVTELCACAGSQFDPPVVEAFLRLRARAGSAPVASATPTDARGQRRVRVTAPTVTSPCGPVDLLGPAEVVIEADVAAGEAHERDSACGSAAGRGYELERVE